jgi:glucokinase
MAILATGLERLNFKMKSKYTLGIDIGGTNTKIALIEQNGSVVEYTTFSTKIASNYIAFESKLLSSIHNILSKHKDKKIIGIGAGAPNIDYLTGTIEHAHNLNWKNVSIKASLQKLGEYPIFFDNDANLAALGEARYGVAQGYSDFISITLGTGVGTGIYSAGEIIHGHSGHAGEGGHIIVRYPGRMCACGGEGHLEAYLGANGIQLTIKEIMKKELTLEELNQLVLQQDENALKVIHFSATILADAISSMVAILSPKLFVLAGGISKLGEPFRQATLDQFNLRAFASLQNTIEIKLSQIDPEIGAVLGAHALVMQKLRQQSLL